MVIWIGHFEILTCCAVEVSVYDDFPRTSVVSELLWLVCHREPARPLSSTLSLRHLLLTGVLTLVRTVLLGYNEVRVPKVQQTLGHFIQCF